MLMAVKSTPMTVNIFHNCLAQHHNIVIKQIFFCQDLDDAVLRRFSKRIYVRLPGREDRLQILLKLLSQQYNDLSIHEVHQVAQLTAGYSGSDLASLARDAAYGPIRELKMDEVKSLDPVELRKVDMNDFLDSMKKMKKSVSPDSLVPFETWNQKFGEASG